MSYYLDQQDQIRLGIVDGETSTPEQAAFDYGEVIGSVDGERGAVSSEGRECLNDWEPVLEGYRLGYYEAFMFRQRMSGRITEAEWHYYGSFSPECWNYGLVWDCGRLTRFSEGAV